MIYPFRCECGATRDEVMRVSEYDDNQLCHMCGRKMSRVFGFNRVAIPNRDGFNVGLGCTERNVPEKLRELRDRGIDVEETGNERIKPKPVHNNYELSQRDVAELDRIMN